MTGFTALVGSILAFCEAALQVCLSVGAFGVAVIVFLYVIVVRHEDGMSMRVEAEEVIGWYG